MIFYQTRRKIRKLIERNFLFCKVLIASMFIPSGSKKIFIDMQEIALNRYLYNFLKFFMLKGYTVYIPRNKKIISLLCEGKGEFVYTSWILKEGVKVGIPKNPDLVISKDQLSNDYFAGKIKDDFFYVPMSEYPGMYRTGIFGNSGTKKLVRKNSIFMAGNLDPHYYRRISTAGFFDIPSRSEVADYLRSKSNYLHVTSLNYLANFIQSKDDNKVILIDTSLQFRIPLKELKIWLSQFNFYLGLPGVLIPQCHNVIEAMAVGCIPIVHRVYAHQFKPPLRHSETAFIYDETKELHDLIKSIFQTEEKEIRTMQSNVLSYYERILSPEAVVKEIERSQFSRIFIQAEDKSLFRTRIKK